MTVPLAITIDTREQQPYQYDPEKVVATRGTVHTFDYAVTGHETEWAIERKGAGDLIKSFMLKDNLQNEMEKIERASTWDWPTIYAIEARYLGMRKADFARFKKQITQEQLDSVLSKIETQHNVHFVWCGNREHAAQYIYRRLKRYYEYTLRRNKERDRVLKNYNSQAIPS